MAGKAEMQTLGRRETTSAQGMERLSQARMVVPQADIYESLNAFHVVANMPGVDATALEVTLEKNVLTLRGHVTAQAPDALTLAHREYESGDFERAFTLSDEIDGDGIAATVSHGLVDILLPKAKSAAIKRIPITGV